LLGARTLVTSVFPLNYYASRMSEIHTLTHSHSHTLTHTRREIFTVRLVFKIILGSLCVHRKAVAMAIKTQLKQETCIIFCPHLDKP
jgi:hypothetical protein